MYVLSCLVQLGLVQLGLVQLGLVQLGVRERKNEAWGTEDGLSSARSKGAKLTRRLDFSLFFFFSRDCSRLSVSCRTPFHQHPTIARHHSKLTERVAYTTIHTSNISLMI